MAKPVVSYYDAILTEADLSLLAPGQWLNDAVIGCAMEVFAHRETLQRAVGRSGEGDSEQEKQPPPPSPQLFLSPAIVHMARSLPADALPSVLGELPLDTCAAAYFPLNDTSETETANAGSHWTLLVFLRCTHSTKGSNGRFLYLDSLGGRAPVYARRLASALAPLLRGDGGDVRVEELECPRQGNAVDCGVHVVANVERIAECVAGGVEVEKAELMQAGEMKRYRDQLNVSIFFFHSSCCASMEPSRLNSSIPDQFSTTQELFLNLPRC
jgi:hypothetical protein